MSKHSSLRSESALILTHILTAVSGTVPRYGAGKVLLVGVEAGL